jgi:hypothetical protein
MSSNDTPTPSLDNIKAQIHELRMARKLNTIRLNAGLQYVSKKIQNETERRSTEHETLNTNIETVKNDLNLEKEK